MLQQRAYHAASLAQHRAKVEKLNNAELAWRQRRRTNLYEEIAYHAANLKFFYAELAAIKRTKGGIKECELRGSKMR